MCALDSKRHSRSSSTYNSLRRLVNNGIHLPPPLKMGVGHRRGVSGGAGRTGEDWGSAGGNRRDETSAAYRRRSAAVMMTVPHESSHMDARDGYVPSHAGGGRARMTRPEGLQQAMGGMVGMVNVTTRSDVDDLMRMGISRDKERILSRVGQDDHAGGEMESSSPPVESFDARPAAVLGADNGTAKEHFEQDMDFYDYLNAHTAKRASADGRGGLVTPVPVKSVLTSVADALESEARSSMAGDGDRTRLGRIASYESFRCGSQDPEVPFSREPRASIAPISPPPKTDRIDNSINSIANRTSNKHSQYQSSLPPLQTAVSETSQYGAGTLLSPLSPFHMRSPFHELYPPSMSLQSPEVQPAPALSPLVQALHPILVPVRQEDGSDIWMQSITPLSPSKQEAIYQNALEMPHEHIQSPSTFVHPGQSWQQPAAYRDHYHEHYQLMSPTSTAATSDMFGWNATSPIHALSPQSHISPTIFGHLDPVSPSAMYPAFNPFEAPPGDRDGFAYNNHGLDARYGSQRSSSGSTPPSGGSSESSASAVSQHQNQSEHQTQSNHAEVEIQWEHILAEVDRKRYSAASSGNLSYGSHKEGSPRFAPTAAGARTSYLGLSSGDTRRSPALHAGYSQSPSPTRMPGAMHLRPVIDTSLGERQLYGALSTAAHKRTTSLVSPTSILSGDSIWGAPGEILSPVGPRQGFGFEQQMEQHQFENSRSLGADNGGQKQRWSGSSSGSGLGGEKVSRTISGHVNQVDDHTYYPPQSHPPRAMFLERDGMVGSRLVNRSAPEDRNNSNRFSKSVNGHYTYSDVLKLKPGYPNGGVDMGHETTTLGDSQTTYQMHMQSVQERAEAQSQHEQAQYTRGHQRIASELDKGYIMERDSEEVTTAYGLLPHGLFIGTPEPSASAADYVGRENGGVQSAAGVVRSDADMSAAVLNGSEAQYDPSIPVAEELLKSKLRSDPARLNRRYFDALSKSILEVVQQVRMGGGKSGRWEQERERLGGVVKTVRMIIESVFPGSTVHQVGSTVSGLALADADLDFTVLFPRGTNYTAVQCVERLAGALKLDGPFGEVKPLPRAKVPILKLKDMATGIRCDISFGNELALHNTKLLATYALLDHRVRQMTVFLKHWVKRKGINFPVMGHPSSYCYTLLVINFLQRRNVIPSLQTLPPSGSGTVPERLLTTSSGSYNVYFHNEPDRLHEIWQTENEETVGELLLAFFKDFGTELDFVYKVSSVRTGGLLHKAEKNWSKDSANGRSGGGRIKHWMAVEDPFDLEQNLSSSVDRDMLHAIRGHFQVASKILCGATDLPASKSLGLETMGTAALARAVVEKICEECEPLKRGGVSGRSAAAFGGGVGRRGRKV